MLESGVVYVDVAIGLAVAFFVLSLVPSGINEAIAFVTRIRSKFLWAYLNQLFTAEPDSASAAEPVTDDSAAATSTRSVAEAGGAAVVPTDRDDVEGELLATTAALRGATRAAAATGAVGLPSSSWQMYRLMRAREERDPRPTLGGRGMLDGAPVDGQSQPIVAELHRRLGPIAVSSYAGRVQRPKIDKPTTTKHIPPSSIAVALVDLLGGGGATDAHVRARLDGLGGTPIHSTLVSLWARANGDLDRFANLIEELFDAEMARLSGLYKRLMRWVLGAAAVLVALAVNLDVFGLTRDLWRDPARRVEFVTVAGSLAPSEEDVTTSQPELSALYDACRAAPAGDDDSDGPSVEDAAAAYDRVRTCVTDALDAQTELGLLGDGVTSGNWLSSYREDLVVGRLAKNAVVAGAIFFGAPFWWDVVRRLMGIRKSVAKQET